jgi:integrase
LHGRETQPNGVGHLERVVGAAVLCEDQETRTIITKTASVGGSGSTRRAASATRCRRTTTRKRISTYLAAAGITEEKKSPLFRSVDKHRQLTANAITRTDVLRMIKQRALEAGLPSSTSCHTFRATGITAYLENGGTIENA